MRLHWSAFRVNSSATSGFKSYEMGMQIPSNLDTEISEKQRLDAIDTIKIWIKIIDDLKRKIT